MHMAIVSMELEVQKHLQQDSMVTSKTKLTKCLLGSEDVMFFWSIVAAP